MAGTSARLTGSLRQISALLMAVALVFGALGIGLPHSVGAGRLPGASVAEEPKVCDGCQPPLTYAGGPVMSTTAAGVMVTPIYWQPGGGKYTFPAGYEAIINGYIANLAAASGQTSNALSVATAYYQDVGGVKTAITYRIQAGTPLTDTSPFPASGCNADSGYTACITDDQLRTQLTAVTSSQKLPIDLAHFYPVFFPSGVETKDRDGTTSASAFCGYHRAFGSGADQVVYGNMPIGPPDGCGAGQSPNGNPTADAEVSTLSHELVEAITDPLANDPAWLDKAGHEIGDMCSDTYQQPLGSTDPSNPSSTEYNQVINGAKYYTQTEFSNSAFTKFGLDHGCAQNLAAAGTGTASGSTSPANAAPTRLFAANHAGEASNTGSLFSEATPTALDADGTSTSKFVVSVADPSGNARVGDRVHFSVGAESGTGTCGTLSTDDASTDANGYARVTYTASKSNIACWVLAVDAAGGDSAESIIYQGTAQKDAASAAATFPSTLQAGGPATTFTIKMTNPSAHPLPNARLTFDIYGEPGAKGVSARQIHLLYSTAGPNGSFRGVPLEGSTGNGGVIETSVGPPQGATLTPHGTRTYTFHVSLADDVPVSSTGGPVIAFEGYLDQVNTASGSGDTLADTYATDINVLSAAGQFDTGRR